jgi:hypothetical protein
MLKLLSLELVSKPTEYFPSLFSLANFGFLMGFIAHFNMMIKCLEIFWNLWCVRYVRSIQHLWSFYTGASQHPQNIGFMSISKVGIHVLMSIDMVCRLKRNTDTDVEGYILICIRIPHPDTRFTRYKKRAFSQELRLLAC